MFDGIETTEIARKLAMADAAVPCDDDLFRVARELTEMLSLVQLAQAHVLAELDRRHACSSEFGMATPHWLAREAAIPLTAAQAAVRTAVALRDALSGVDDAVATGAIGFDHARELVRIGNPRVRDKVADLQDELIGLARGAQFEQWRREVRGIVELLDEDGGHDPDDDLARNRLSVAESIDGITFVRGQLVGEQALTFAERIDAKADELFTQFARDRETSNGEITIPPRATLRALALAELVRAGAAVDESSSVPPRPEIMFLINADDADTVHDQLGRQLPPTTTRTLVCDASFFALVLDGLGVPLDLGRHRRFASRAQRRALVGRDGGCVFPGCGRPISWCDIHHEQGWVTGGRTDLAKLAPLCRLHHGVSHRTGWTMTATDDGWFWWQTPKGRTPKGGGGFLGRPLPADIATRASDVAPLLVSLGTKDGKFLAATGMHELPLDPATILADPSISSVIRSTVTLWGLPQEPCSVDTTATTTTFRWCAPGRPDFRFTMIKDMTHVYPHGLDKDSNPNGVNMVDPFWDFMQQNAGA